MSTSTDPEVESTRHRRPEEIGADEARAESLYLPVYEPGEECIDAQVHDPHAHIQDARTHTDDLMTVRREWFHTQALGIKDELKELVFEVSVAGIVCIGTGAFGWVFRRHPAFVIGSALLLAIFMGTGVYVVLWRRGATERQRLRIGLLVVLATIAALILGFVGWTLVSFAYCC